MAQSERAQRRVDGWGSRCEERPSAHEGRFRRPTLSSPRAAMHRSFRAREMYNAVRNRYARPPECEDALRDHPWQPQRCAANDPADVSHLPLPQRLAGHSKDDTIRSCTSVLTRVCPPSVCPFLRLLQAKYASSHLITDRKAVGISKGTYLRVHYKNTR